MEGNYYSSSGADREGYDNYRQGGRGRQGSGLERDRGREEMPPPRSGGRGAGFRGTPENSKTKICIRWKNGDCGFGDRCNFAHGESELRRSQPPPQSYFPSSHDAARNGYHSEVEGGYPEEGGHGHQSRGNYRSKHREGGRREYNEQYPTSRGGRTSSSYGAGRGVNSREEVPLRSNYEDHRRDFPPSTDEEQRYEYVPPQQRGIPYRSKDEDRPPKHPLADYSEKPEAMSDEVWAGSGFAVPGPAGWWRYMTDKGEHYYHNYRTKETQWDKPDGWTIVTIPPSITS